MRLTLAVAAAAFACLPQPPALAGQTCALLGCAGGTVDFDDLGCVGPSALNDYRCSYRWSGEFHGSSTLPDIRVVATLGDGGYFDCAALTAGCDESYWSGTHTVYGVARCEERAVSTLFTVTTTATGVLVALHQEDGRGTLNPRPDC